MKAMISACMALVCVGYGATSHAAVSINTTSSASDLAGAILSSTGAITITSVTYDGAAQASG